jgi:hypothetical protein
MASGHAQRRFRRSKIPLPRRWHVGACISMLAASGLFLAARTVGLAGAASAPGIERIAIWTLPVGES